MASALIDIAYTKTIVLEAYHGTSSKSAEKILQTKQFKLSTEDTEFFGHGVYFYERDPSHCIVFARKACKRDNSTECVTLQATIELGRCFDLLIQEHREILEFTLEKLSCEKHAATSDGAAINYLADNVYAIDTVKGLAIFGGYISGSTYTRKTQRSMIVVRNTDNITEISSYKRERYYGRRQ